MLIDENQTLRLKIEGLVQEIEKLQADIQVMVQRQRETGTMANDALTQLEVEIDGFQMIANSRVKQTNTELEGKNSALLSENADLKRQYEELIQLEKTTSRNFESAKIKISQLGIDSDSQRLKIRELNSKISQTCISNEKLQLSVSDLTSKLEERERQLGELRELISEVDKERDGFQNDLDYKAERIQEFEGT